VITIYQHAPVGQYLGEERSLGFNVFELHDVNSAAEEPRELRAEIGDALRTLCSARRAIRSVAVLGSQL
jgi:hypothetical protein